MRRIWFAEREATAVPDGKMVWKQRLGWVFAKYFTEWSKISAKTPSFACVSIGCRCALRHF
jgi:hypothetical protein